MDWAAVVVTVGFAAATLVPLVLGFLKWWGYQTPPKQLADSTHRMVLSPGEYVMSPTTTAEMGPHLALEIRSLGGSYQDAAAAHAQAKGPDEISAASKTTQRRIERMNRSDWDHQWRTLTGTLNPQPTPDCTCSWVDDTTLSGTTHHTRTTADPGCPDHQEPPR
jgi:hypothetical protein